jgi:hypothetical protein
MYWIDVWITYLLDSYYVQGPVLGTADIALKEIAKAPFLRKHVFCLLHRKWTKKVAAIITHSDTIIHF